jgi:hypothetical protein
MVATYKYESVPVEKIVHPGGWLRVSGGVFILSKYIICMHENVAIKPNILFN